MAVWDIFEIEQGYRIGRSVVRGGNKMGVFRNDNAILCDMLANLRLVGYGGEKTSVGLARIAPTRAAVEGRLVWIVVRDAGVSAHHHQPAEIPCQSRHSENCLDTGVLLFGSQAKTGAVPIAGHPRGQGRDNCVLKLFTPSTISPGKQCAFDHLQAEEPPERLDHDVRR